MTGKEDPNIASEYVVKLWVAFLSTLRSHPNAFQGWRGPPFTTSLWEPQSQRCAGPQWAVQTQSKALTPLQSAASRPPHPSLKSCWGWGSTGKGALGCAGGRDMAPNTGPKCPTLSLKALPAPFWGTLFSSGVCPPAGWLSVLTGPAGGLRAAIAHGHAALLSGPGLDFSLPLSTDTAHQGHQEPGRGKPSAHLFLAITWVQFSTYGNSLSEFSQETSLGPPRRAVRAHRSGDGVASGAFGPSGPHARPPGHAGLLGGAGLPGTSGTCVSRTEEATWRGRQIALTSTDGEMSKSADRCARTAACLRGNGLDPEGAAQAHRLGHWEVLQV